MVEETAVTEEPADSTDVEEASAEHAQAADEEVASVPLPPSVSEPASEEADVPLPTPAAEESEVPIPTEQDSAEPAPAAENEDGNVALPETEEEVVEVSELETEVRAFFQELIDSGVEPSAFMDDPRWEDLNERCIAEGLESWPILLQMTAMA